MHLSRRVTGGVPAVLHAGGQIGAVKWSVELSGCTQATISQEYIGGLSLSSEEHVVVVAAADGTASLLDMRKSGAIVSHVACGAPLHCATSDGCMAILGREDGQVCHAFLHPAGDSDALHALIHPPDQQTLHISALETHLSTLKVTQAAEGITGQPGSFRSLARKVSSV